MANRAAYCDNNHIYNLTIDSDTVFECNTLVSLDAVTRFTDSVDAATAIPVVGVAYVVLAAAAAVHVLLNKRNEGAAFSWIGIIVLSPIFGAFLYALFGINRMRGVARSRHVAAAQRRPSRLDPVIKANNRVDRRATNEALANAEWESLQSLRTLDRTGTALHGTELLPGNSVQPLVNGDQAYPAMLKAINEATYCVLLSSYIFQHDAAGNQFVEALVAAQKRGVVVRVLIDGVGARYGLWSSRADHALSRRGVSTARFLSAFNPRSLRFINLRNHRKVLIVDGEVGFIGGINIRIGNVLARAKRHRTADVHFVVRGQVVEHITAVFLADWFFATGEALAISRRGDEAAIPQTIDTAKCRVLVDGPDNNYEKLRLSLVAALNSAQDSIVIVTPYFLPNNALLDALQLASLRGVDVQVLLPRRSNLMVVEWAMRANERRWLARGIRLFLSDAPFDHSKFFLVDKQWTLIGSSNWDARSLELNFEINLECVDEKLNQSMQRLFEEKLKNAQALLSPRDTTILPRLRNNFCRLFSPYL